MHTQLYNQEAEVIGEVDLSDKVFAVPMNQDLLHQVTTSLMANMRQNIAHTKGRGVVRGGGKKPWQQKGTGRARHGSSRSPIWKGGGVTHGPTKEKDFTKKINRKMARKALAIALSAKVKDQQLIVVDAVTLELAKTKNMAHVMKRFATILPGYVTTKRRTSSMLLIVPSHVEAAPITRAARNIPYLKVASASDLNTLVILGSKYTVLAKGAAEIIEKMAKVASTKA